MGTYMASKKIKINTNSLNQTRKEIQARLDGIKKGMEQISDGMSTLNSMWTGEAHNAFEQKVNEDIVFLTSVCDSIQSIINYESNAVVEYNKCEQQVSELVAQIRV